MTGLVRRFRRDRRAGTATMIALSMTVIVGMVGMGVDLGRVYAVRSQLQTAVDASALSAAKQVTTTTRDADATKLFGANFYLDPATTVTAANGAKVTAGYLGATVADKLAVNGGTRANPLVTPVDANNVQVTGTATVTMGLASLLGFKELAVTATATAQRQGYEMELALVLDNTWSMSMYSSSPGDSNDKIGALRTAANNLVDTVLGSGGPSSKVWISVVPYATAVNVGSGRTNWLAAGSYTASAFGGQGWRGCVQARANDEDLTDTPPGGAPFRPFLWASTKGLYKDAKGNPLRGDNDWTANGITDAGTYTTSFVNFYYGGQYWPAGPNLSCAAVPIRPLTQAAADVKATINALTAPASAGTISNLGLQAGWWTLSPRWRGAAGWGDGVVPKDYDKVQKVMILMTDGENEIISNIGPAWAPSSVQVDSFYTAYGRLSENRLGAVVPGVNAASSGNIGRDEDTGDANTVKKIDARMAAVCTNIKKAGITLYTVGFDLPANSMTSNVRTLLTNCATRPEYFFYSTNTGALIASFQQIAGQLASLRLTK